MNYAIHWKFPFIFYILYFIYENRESFVRVILKQIITWLKIFQSHTKEPVKGEKIVQPAEKLLTP
jgi:hypothetical protein